MSNRIWNMNVEPYDQVLALTQHMINEGISNLYLRLATGEIVDGTKLPKPASVKVDEHSGIKDVEFGPPAVIVKPSFSNTTAVHVRLHLKKGHITLRRWLETDEDDRTRDAVIELPVKDWFVTVLVDLKFEEVATKPEDLAAESPRVKAIRERSAAKGKADFSIYELLMDLSSMRSNDATWEMGKWTDNDWVVTRLDKQPEKKDRPPGWGANKQRLITDFDETWQTSLQTWMPQLAKSIQKANLNSLGFAVMAKDANRRATFEVNDTRYQTYPWVNPDTKVAAAHGLSGDGRLNYLLYLQTVGTNAPPKASLAGSVLSPYMGNWTDGRSPGTDKANTYGSFVLSASNFMDGYILKKFSALNRCMSTDIHNVTAWCQKKVDGGWLANVSASHQVGVSDPKDDDTQYKLKKGTLSVADDWHAGAKEFFKPMTESPGDNAVIWVYKDVEWGPTAKHAHAEDGDLSCLMHGDTITFCRAFVIPGTNTITYEGRTWTKFEENIVPPAPEPTTNWLGVKTLHAIVPLNSVLTLQAKWKVTLTLAEVVDGGMKINVTHEKPKVEVNVVGSEEIKDWQGLGTGAQNRFTTASQNFEYYMNSVRNCLQGQEGFTLPASGVFYFKDPVLDKHSNLLCNLGYNGNPALDQVNPNGSTRDTIGRGEFTPPVPANYSDKYRPTAADQ